MNYNNEKRREALRKYFVIPETELQNNNDGCHQHHERTLEDMGFGMENTQLSIVNSDPAELILDNIKQGVLKNTKVYVGEKSFDCDLMLLRCYSKYFKKCKPQKDIKLPTEMVSADAFADIKNWMLNGELNINVHNIVELLQAADFLQIAELAKACWSLLNDEKGFKDHVACHLFCKAKKFKNSLIKPVMLSKIGKYFLNFVATKEYLKLSDEELQILLCSSQNAVYTEIEVFFAAVHWCCHKFDERLQFIAKIFKCIRFKLMSLLALGTLGHLTVDAKAQLILNHAAVRALIGEAILYKEENDVHEICSDSCNEPRQWIIDYMCSYHHEPRCMKDNFLTYEQFLQYLQTIKCDSKRNWKNLMPRDFRQNKDTNNFRKL